MVTVNGINSLLPSTSYQQIAECNQHSMQEESFDFGVGVGDDHANVPDALLGRTQNKMRGLGCLKNQIVCEEK